MKKQLENNSKLEVTIPDNVSPTSITKTTPTGNDLILYLSDMHIGATLTYGALYEENVKDELLFIALLMLLLS